MMFGNRRRGYNNNGNNNNNNPWNPYHDRRRRGYGGGPPPAANGRQPPMTARRRHHWRDHLRAAAIAAAALCVWYVTPVSQWVTDVLLLWQVPVAEDVALGRQALQDGFAHRYPSVYDAHYTPMLQSIGHDLVRTHRNMHYSSNNNDKRRQYYSNEWLGDKSRTSDPYQWDFAVVRSDSINAFALPGGIVRVTSALLHALRPTPGELAALVGHEMGHVLHRHSQARILQKQLLSNVLQALLDGSSVGVGGGDQQGYLGGQRGGRRKKTESFGGAIGELLLESAQWLGDQKFSRRDEYQADAVAWDLLLASDSYNPQSVISLLSKLDRQEQRFAADVNSAAAAAPGSRGITSAIEEWTRTHPATSDRLKALEKKWKDLPPKERRRLQERRVA
jgi:predicted Zn-dependent protease